MCCTDIRGGVKDAPASHGPPLAGLPLREDYPAGWADNAPVGHNSFTIRLTLTTRPVSRYWTCTRHGPRDRLRRPSWYRTISARFRSTRGCCCRTAVYGAVVARSRAAADSAWSSCLINLRPCFWGSVARHCAGWAHPAHWRWAKTNVHPVSLARRSFVPVCGRPGHVTTPRWASRTNASGGNRGIGARLRGSHAAMSCSCGGWNRVLDP